MDHQAVLVLDEDRDRGVADRITVLIRLQRNGHLARNRVDHDAGEVRIIRHRVERQEITVAVEDVRISDACDSRTTDW